MIKKFKVTHPNEMLGKLNDGLNRHKQVLVVSIDDGYIIIYADDLLDKCGVI
jgi:hypothetical protein